MSVKIEWNEAGFDALRQDPAVQKHMAALGGKVARAAGEGYELREPTEFPNRDRVAVITATAQARADNARNMTLVKALGAAR